MDEATKLFVYTVQVYQQFPEVKYSNDIKQSAPKRELGGGIKKKVGRIRCIKRSERQTEGQEIIYVCHTGGCQTPQEKAQPLESPKYQGSGRFPGIKGNDISQSIQNSGYNPVETTSNRYTQVPFERQGHPLISSPCVLSYHHELQQDIKKTKQNKQTNNKTRKNTRFTNSQKLHTTVLNEKQVKAEIEDEIINFLEFNENEYATCTILFNTRK